MAAGPRRADRSSAGGGDECKLLPAGPVTVPPHGGLSCGAATARAFPEPLWSEALRSQTSMQLFACELLDLDPPSKAMQPLSETPGNPHTTRFGRP